MPSDLVMELSPTQLDFVLCDDEIVQLEGPMGEGKTFGGVAGLIGHAKRCGTDIRAALVRDTFQNIKTSTKPDIIDYLGPWVNFTDAGKKMIINSQPRVECDLFGIDDEASISKLQGPQYACIWLEEPAPIFEKANAGLPREVLNMAIARAARQRGTKMRVQLTHNPADEEHWTAQLADEPREYASYEDPDTGEIFTIHKTTMRIPPGENKFLPGITRAALRGAFKDDPAKQARYIEGKPAEVYRGKKVTPGYSPKIHFPQIELPVFEGPALQFWDGWHHPTCIIAQYNPFGQLVIHDVLVDDELTATQELIKEKVKPRLLTPKYRKKIKSWQIIGDGTMMTPDQSSIHTSAAKIIEKEFSARFEPGPVRWPIRRESINHRLKQMLNEGRPRIVLSSTAVKLHRALKGGWHYKTDHSGNVLGELPNQRSPHSHPGNAFAYGIAVLMPYDPRKKFKRPSKQQQMKSALSYRGGNYRGKSRIIRSAVPGM